MLALFICLIPIIFSSQIDPQGAKHLGGATGVGKVLWPLAFMLGFVSTLHSVEMLLHVHNKAPRNWAILGLSLSFDSPVKKVCVRAKWPIRLELIPVSVA